MKDLFTKHPNSLNPPENYITHLFRSSRNGCWLIVAGIIAFIHAVFPFLFEVTASNIVIALMKKWKT